MSNLIKAYTIRYNEDNRKVVDSNAAAEAKVQHYLELLHIREEKVKEDQDGFVEGITAASVEEIPEEEQEEQAEPNEHLTAIPLDEELIKNAEETADRIIEQAKQEADQIIKKAQKEAMEEVVRAKDMGYEEGISKGKEEIQHILEQEKAQLEEKDIKRTKEYETKIKEFEPVFADLLIAYVKRFTGVILDDKRDIILYLIEQELFNIDSSNTYLIHVSKDDYEIVAAKKNELKWKVKENAEIEIIEDRSLTRAQCLIETDSRVIDCSLDVQLKNLINDLRLLAGPREDYFSQIGASDDRD